MRPILRVPTIDRIELNALFIQPTRWCAGNCKGCYVKKHFPESKQIDLEELRKLVRYFLTDPRYWTNQLTISIDELPPDDGVHKDALKRHHMLKTFEYVLAIRLEDKKAGPELHMTMRNIRTLLSYTADVGTSQYAAADKLDMISFSEIDLDRDYVDLLNLRARGAKINYNHLIPADINSDNIREYASKIERIAQNVDSIYLVLFKEPMGSFQNTAIFARRKARLRHDIAVINSLKKLLSLKPSGGANLIVDGCLDDVVRFHRHGHTCSSNVSRFQVWPDGSVSGCAYAYKGGEPTDTVVGILKNILDARGRPEFHNGCYLHQVYDSLIKRPSNPGP